MALTLDIKSFVAIIFILSWTCTSRATSRTFYDESESSIAKRHEEWMASYGRTYEHDGEKDKRREIFKQNLEFIEKFNSQGNKTFKLGLNRFADLLNEEFVAFYTGYNPQKTRRSAGLPKVDDKFGYYNVSLDDIEPSLDWREKGAVNPIKNQYRCGSCWAFSSVAAMESVIQIKTGQLLSLSEQQLVDCASNAGCSGYNMDLAYQYVAQGQGLASESEYPYEATDGNCRDGMVNPVAKITGYKDVPEGNEDELLKAVSMQPVSVAIEGSGQAFQLYKEGVFTGECGTQLNHAVTIIGYGEDDEGSKYWVVRNSWGQDWGEGGYMKIQRDTGNSDGLCGINMKPSFPVY